MIFRQLFDRDSCTYTYLLADKETREAMLIDPVREQIQRDKTLLTELKLTLRYTLETHVHADHVTSSGLFREQLKSKSVISKASGSECADILLEDGDELHCGAIRIVARTTPGHTDSCMSFYLPQMGMIFTGDTLMIRGCGRTDFQQGDAKMLYRSVHDKIFTLPGETAIYPGHDYKGRTLTTVWEEREYNPRLGGSKTESEFVSIMSNLNLSLPQKINEAVPANMECGLNKRETTLDAATPLSPNADDTWAPIYRESGVPTVSIDFLLTGLPEGFRLIDVRTFEEHLEAKIPNAELVPMDILTSQAVIWDKEQPIIIHCRSGRRSARAANMLESMGFKKVASLAGGQIAWDNAKPSNCG